LSFATYLSLVILPRNHGCFFHFRLERCICLVFQ
jgi:hypothetical protein